jgi:protein TonB
MVNRGWLYGLIIFLAQTCNPYYSANDTRNQEEEEIVFEESEVDEIPEQVFELEEEPIFYIDQEIEKPKEEKVFKIVEQMPRFPGCEGKGLSDEKLKICSDKEMLEFVYGNIKYPKGAQENGIEGRVILVYLVNKDGTISDVEVLRDPGGGCGEEAMRVIKMMPKWIPGKSRGKVVQMKYTFPVSFKLNKKDRRRKRKRRN